jgi:opacity protein-like surface antigen
MSKRVAIAKAGVATLAGVIALSAAVQAQAQSSAPPPPTEASRYSAQSADGYNYDACKRAKTERGTVGALLGGAGGAVVGSNVAARNTRTEGALLGGLLGAIAGGVVGNNTAACDSNAQYAPPPPPPPPRASSSYYQRDYYAERGSYRHRYGDDGWAYGGHGDRYRVVEDRAPDPDGCTLAESPIYMPDGRTQMRFVRVCRGSDGRYAVVD